MSNNDVFLTRDRRYLSPDLFNLQYETDSFRLGPTSVSHPTNLDPYGTQFLILIKQTGWIDETNVYLVTDGHYLPSKFILEGCFEEDPGTRYSLFFSSYHYREPCKNMEAHFYYRIGYTEYSTSSMYFDVLPV